MQAFSSGLTAFRETYVSSGTGNGADLDFSSYGARRLRYALYRALYDNSVYRGAVHGWSSSFRQSYGLYRYIRAIEAPTAELITFWQTHLYGGSLDPDAGDGRGVASAIPILTDSERLRDALAIVWRWSNWATKKDTYALLGARDGDTAIQVVDDVRRGKTYLKILDPARLVDLEFDDMGNVRGYTYQEQRAHPTTGKAVTYQERVNRDGENVLYQTLLDDNVFAWPGNEDANGKPRAAWSEPYGFVPLVWVNHIDTDTDFGLSELHAGLPIFRELDDTGSALDDQIRKAVQAPWLMAGVEDPKLRGSSDARQREATPTATNPAPGRQELPIFYGPVGATATPLVAPLDIAGVNQRVEALHTRLRSRYPELDTDIATAAGDASGRALRVARQKAETKVNLRRSVYDDALVRAQQMAVSIAGMRRWKGFEGFSLESYAAGKLDHQIGARPVFAVSTADEIEEDRLFWVAAEQATKAGATLRGYLQDKGWDDARIALVAPERDVTPIVPPIFQGSAQENGAQQADKPESV
jgi:hypothetical protein